jgi:cbb3-type cytochrome oxidase subunit 1
MLQTAMKRVYFAVVALTVGAHFAYLLYLPSGGFLALRWPRTILLHAVAVAWGFAVVGLRFPCPLTSLERWARARAQMDPLPAGGFVDRYAAGVCYPANRTGVAQTLAFLTAGFSWAVLAARRRT